MNILPFLLQVADRVSSESVKELTAGLREAILTTGSETPDNLDCAGSLSFEAIEGGYPEIVCRDSGVVLGDLCWMLEEDEIIAFATEKLRSHAVSPEDVRAALRLITLMICSIGGNHNGQTRKRGTA